MIELPSDPPPSTATAQTAPQPHIAAPVVTIVGVGLIGGSIGLGLKRAGWRGTILGVGRDPQCLQNARRRGAIDQAVPTLARAAAVSDLVVVCTPVDRIAANVAEALAHGPDHLAVTDAGSVKAAILRDLRLMGETAGPRSRNDSPAPSRFVAAHPLAGSELAGVEHARDDLFLGRVCVLTPSPVTDPDALERVSAFWTTLGCRLVSLDPEEHDRVLALTSHLPHLIASALAGCITPRDQDFAAGAYRDLTRVAAADAGLWRAILQANRAALDRALDLFRARLDQLRAALDDHPSATRFEHLWNEAAQRRRDWTFDPPGQPD